jgi:ankyrin repeat protein
MISKNVKNYILNSFDWIKRDLLILMALLFGFALFIHYIDLGPIFKSIIIGGLLIRCLTLSMTRSTSQGNFSWKFMQGLPLTKKELIQALCLTNLLEILPLVTFFILYWKPINKEIFDNQFELIRFTAFLILFSILMGMWMIKTQIEFPRVEYQKRNANNKLIRSLRFYLLCCVFLTYFGIACYYLENSFHVPVAYYFKIFFKSFEVIASSWWLHFIILIIIVIQCYQVLKVWSNEKLSYRSNAWNQQKEYSLITGSTIMLVLAFSNIDFKTPNLYKGALTKAVYEKRYDLIEEELRIHPNINVKNKEGVTALLAAIHLGDLEMVKYLDGRGANLQDSVTGKNRFKGVDSLLMAIKAEKKEIVEYLLTKKMKADKFYEKEGYYPLHLAAHTCNASIIDLLIKNGADINSLNKEGETPLHVSVKTKCFSGTVTLKEAGADFSTLDKNGKRPIDILKDQKTELSYFVEKNSRFPASQKRLSR